MENWKEGLAPVISKASRVLILGSLPGDLSLQRQQYYANPKNQFWTILGAVFGCSPSLDYESRVGFVLEHRLALWDVLRAADREGSLDKNIRRSIPNDFEKLFAAYPDICLIALNGGDATSEFKAIRKRHATLFLDRECIDLPSSSGVPGRNVLPLPEKIQRWAAIKVAEQCERVLLDG